MTARLPVSSEEVNGSAVGKYCGNKCCWLLWLCGESSQLPSRASPADLRSNLLLLIQEYQDEISTLTADLTSARDQTGVFMSKEKYQALMDQMNRQKIAIDQEKVGRSRE